jgi:serine/threonine-protein kinase
MPEHEDLYVGRSALEQGLVSPEHLLECLIDRVDDRRARDGHMAPRTLAQILVSRGYLKQEDLQRILILREKSREETVDLDLARVVVSRGYAPRERVDEGLALQRAAPGRRLGEILLERGWITAAHFHEALASLHKANFFCPACGAVFNVPYAQPGGRYSCRDCGALLQPQAAETLAGKGGPAEIPETERALAVYIRQKNMVRREILHEAEQIQKEAASFGILVPLLEVLERRKMLTWQQTDRLRKVDLSSVAASEQWLKQVVPGYKILTKIATGGFATIFAAEPFFGGSWVALKVLTPGRAAEKGAVEHFRREARLMMLLEHPRIVHAYEYGEHKGLHYITMEFVEGRALDQAVEDSGGLPAAAALKVASQVAEALHYMQREGYIHRDVKPENILLDLKGDAKVCDLGFATEIRAPRATLRTRDEALGTAAYVSPEQARGEADLKVGTDIYSLGLTLYFMLTAHVPFDGEDNEVIMAERFSEGVASPDYTRLKVVAPLQMVLRKMLHPEREKRFATYPELLEAFKSIPL